jgi:hypothetical protein
MSTDLQDQYRRWFSLAMHHPKRRVRKKWRAATIRRSKKAKERNADRARGHGFYREPPPLGAALFDGSAPLWIRQRWGLAPKTVSLSVDFVMTTRSGLMMTGTVEPWDDEREGSEAWS